MCLVGVVFIWLLVGLCVRLLVWLYVWLFFFVCPFVCMLVAVFVCLSGVCVFVYGCVCCLVGSVLFCLYVRVLVGLFRGCFACLFGSVTVSRFCAWLVGWLVFVCVGLRVCFFWLLASVSGSSVLYCTCVCVLVCVFHVVC